MNPIKLWLIMNFLSVLDWISVVCHHHGEALVPTRLTYYILFWAHLLAGVQVVTKAIREHKNAEKALQASNKKYEKLLEGATKRSKTHGCANGQKYAHFTPCICKRCAHDTINVRAFNPVLLSCWSTCLQQKEEKHFLQRVFCQPKWGPQSDSVIVTERESKRGCLHDSYRQ